jgi:hypothetical protein
MADTDPSDLETLLPDHEVTVNGEPIVVTPLFFGQYPKAIKLVRPLASVIQKSGAFSAIPITGPDGKASVNLQANSNWFESLPMLLEEGGEALIQFFAFAIGKPREWFDKVPGDEGFDLAHAILKANSDFFVRKILPKFAEWGLTNTVQKVSDGAPLQPSSLASDIPGTPSSE